MAADASYPGREGEGWITLTLRNWFGIAFTGLEKAAHSHSYRNVILYPYTLKEIETYNLRRKPLYFIVHSIPWALATKKGLNCLCGRMIIELRTWHAQDFSVLHWLLWASEMNEPGEDGLLQYFISQQISNISTKPGHSFLASDRPSGTFWILEAVYLYSNLLK